MSCSQRGRNKRWREAGDTVQVLEPAMPLSAIAPASLFHANDFPFLLKRFELSLIEVLPS